MRVFIALPFILIEILGFSQTQIGFMTLGETNISILAYDSGKPGPLYYNMHDNENTSVEAASAVVRRKGGVLIELVHSGGRYIEFEHDGVDYAIDPNRIYTDIGIWRELERRAQRDTAVFEMVRAFATELLGLLRIDQQSLVVALHNNTDCRYCLYSYTAGGDYESDAEATFQSKWKDPDEFYFLTQKSHFERLKDSGFHLVLQDNSMVTDDGSLSVYCAQKSVSYINVEAQHGKVRAQRKMLKKMLRALRD